MTQSTRKLIGTVGLIVLLVAYPLAAMEIYSRWLADMPWWAAIGYAIVAGLLWAVPAGYVIRWMAKAG
jgi:hypothetical protein